MEEGKEGAVMYHCLREKEVRVKGEKMKIAKDRKKEGMKEDN